MIAPMAGDLVIRGHRLARAGFMIGEPPRGYELGPSTPVYTRGAQLSEKTTELIERMQRIDLGDGVTRVDLTGDLPAIVKQLGSSLAEVKRALTSATVPVRENLEAPARLLVPLETPMRNKIPRVPGAGTAAQWRQLTSLGGGYGFATTVTSGAASATQTVASTAGMQVGDVLQFVTATTGIPIGGTTVASLRTISSITSATVVVLAATITTVTGDLVVNTGKAAGDVVTGSTTAAQVPGRPMGAGPASGLTPTTYFGRSFFAEAGAPAEKTETYANKTAAYKLLGAFGSITAFAMAVGATYQPQRGAATRHTIQNLMLNEENAIVNGSSTSLLPPWGDFTNALGFDGLINLITTANGVPANQVQTSVGALTLAHVDSQLTRIWDFGGQGQWILASGQEINSFVHLAEAAGSIIRLQATMQGESVLGLRVTGYVHPVTGQVVPLIASRYLAPGTLIFGSDFLPDGTSALEMDVLPQVELPELAPNEMIQGYVLQELAPTTAAPQNFPWLASVFEVLKLLGSTVFGKSTGVTAV